MCILTATALVASPAIAIAVAPVVAVVTIPIGHGCYRDLRTLAGLHRKPMALHTFNCKMAFRLERLFTYCAAASKCRLLTPTSIHCLIAAPQTACTGKSDETLTKSSGAHVQDDGVRVRTQAACRDTRQCPRFCTHLCAPNGTSVLSCFSHSSAKSQNCLLPTSVCYAAVRPCAP